MEILNKLFVAFISSILYTFFAFLINYGLHYIKNNDSDDYKENYVYSFITNFILIFLVLLFLKIEV